MKKISTKLLFILLISIASLVICGIVISIKEVIFIGNCKVYLQEAANASNVEVAKENLYKVISYAEDNSLIAGNTSILSFRKENDIGIWYNNILSCKQKIEKLPKNLIAYQEDIALTELRNSLTEIKNNEIVVKVPKNIYIYPNNSLYFFWELTSFASILISLILIGWEKYVLKI